METATIVLAFEDEGTALAQAWEMGAFRMAGSGIVYQNPVHALFKIDAQYKRNQDSRDLPSARWSYRNAFYPIQLNCPIISLNLFQPSAYLSGTGMIIGLTQ